MLLQWKPHILQQGRSESPEEQLFPRARKAISPIRQITSPRPTGVDQLIKGHLASR